MEIEREIAQHHTATIRAIETGRVELAIRRMEAYVEFAKAFLNAAAARGVTFSSDAAKSVSFLDWRTPTQIISHAYKGILAAVKSGNTELIAASATIPIQFMKMSMEKNDFLFYRKISQIYPAMLSTAYARDTALNKEHIIHCSWLYLREFANYIMPGLVLRHDQKTREEYMSQLVWFFGDLMKVAVDQNDTNTFGTIGSEMNTLFNYLEFQKLPNEDVVTLEARIMQERALIWFGLGAWIMRSFILAGTKREPGQPDPKLIDSSQITNFLELIARNFLNIKQLANTYEKALTHEYESRMWLGWLMETLPEGQVHNIDFNTWLTYFYVADGLRLSKTGGLIIDDIPEPFRELEFRMKGIREKVKMIKAERHKWDALIPWLKTKPTEKTADRTRWTYFISANEAAVEEWTRRRENQIIASSIDPQSVAIFKEQCLKGWNASSWLVKIISNMGQRVNAIAKTGDTYRAVHERVPKEAFIASNDIPYVGLGFDQGATIGRDINNILLSLIEAKAQNIKLSNTSVLIDELINISRTMILDNSALVIFVKGSIDVQNKFLSIPEFSTRWTQANPRFTFTEYLGDMNSIPLFFIYDKLVSQIIIADLSRIGKLIWHVPQEHNVEGLLIRITEIDEEKANSLVDGQPKFMLDKDGTKLIRELAIRNLLLDVDVFVGVKIDLKINKNPAIKKIQFFDFEKYSG